MKKAMMILTLVLSFVGQAQASSSYSQTILAEWARFRSMVANLDAEGEVGGYMKFVRYDNMTLLWRTSADKTENEVIRFFQKRPSGDVFAVTYHKSKDIVPGATVIRRFVGTEPSGWINHTVDYFTGDYLGSQGGKPYLMPAERQLMSDWKIADLE